MEMTMSVEPAGWGWLRFADAQVVITIRVSYVSDVMTGVVDTIAEVAGGAESAETLLGLEPGEAVLRIERRDETRSTVSLHVSERWGVQSTVGFPVPSGSLARLGLDLAASVDREKYLGSWGPAGTWPTEALERLRSLDETDQAS